MSRPVFYSTACLPGKEPLERRIARLMEAGVPGIELGQNVSISADAGWKSLRELPVSWAVHNYFPPPATDFLLNLAAEDPASVDFCRQALRVCGEIGACIYSVHGGFRSDIPVAELGRPIQARPVAAYEEAYARLRVALEDLCDAAGAVMVLVEPNVVAGFNAQIEDQLLMVRSRELRRLAEDLRRPNFGVLVDTGHLKVTAASLGFDPQEFLSEIGPWVKAFHLHSNDGTKDTHQPSRPGDWTFEAVRRFPGVPVIVEARFETEEALARYHAEIAWN